MEVSGQLLTPAALPQRKGPTLPIRYEAGGDPRISLDTVARRRNPCPCRESNPGRPARDLVTVLTYELPWLLGKMEIRQRYIFTCLIGISAPGSEGGYLP